VLGAEGNMLDWLARQSLDPARRRYRHKDFREAERVLRELIYKCERSLVAFDRRRRDATASGRHSMPSPSRQRFWD
jgi:hypothetical protein